MSCAVRERRRTRRPNATSGSTITGIARMTKRDSRGLVTAIMIDEPMNSTRLRNATDTDEPTALLICVVSAVSREVISPVLAVSKKPGASSVRCANTAARRSATTRSPMIVTR